MVDSPIAAIIRNIFGEPLLRIRRYAIFSLNILINAAPPIPIKQAIEAAGSAEPDAIRDQLEATDSFDGLLGHMSVDPANHNPSRDAAIFRVDADEVTYVGIYDPSK